MPTPSLKEIIGTGCTPPASTPPNQSAPKPVTRLSQQSNNKGMVTRKAGVSKNVKSFVAPRKKK